MKNYVLAAPASSGDNADFPPINARYKVKCITAQGVVSQMTSTQVGWRLRFRFAGLPFFDLESVQGTNIGFDTFIGCTFAEGITSAAGLTIPTAGNQTLNNFIALPTDFELDSRWQITLIMLNAQAGDGWTSDVTMWYEELD